MRRIARLRPSPALVVAVVAVILAGVGGATAADLVTSKDIKNGTIKAGDLSRSVRQKLDDHYFARVGPDGSRLAGEAVRSTSRTSVGDFQVVFRKDVDRCVPVATVRGTAQAEFYGFITTYTPSDDTIRVVLRDRTGAKADGVGFNLAVIC
jgi:hypothetical protein